LDQGLHRVVQKIYRKYDAAHTHDRPNSHSKPCVTDIKSDAPEFGEVPVRPPARAVASLGTALLWPFLARTEIQCASGQSHRRRRYV